MRKQIGIFNLIFALAAVFNFSGCTKKRTVSIYTSIYKEVIEEIKVPLQKAVPDTEIEWFQSGSETIASKVNAEIASGQTKADLILTSDPFWYYELKESGKLLPYPSQFATNVPKEHQQPDGSFLSIRLPVMVIGYHSEKLRPEELPQTWQDLLSPKWKGKIAMPSPLESGSSFTSVALLSRKFGWDYFKKLRQQDILSAGGNSTVITRIETQERPIGIVLLENILKAQAKGSPVRAIYPKDGVIPISSPIAILKDTSEPDAAKKIYDWFLTQEAQKAIVKSGMYSLLPEIPSPQNAKPFAELKTQLMDWSPIILQELFNKRAEIKSKFTDLVLR